MSQPSAPSTDQSGVFLSYSRKDGADFAAKLRLKLEAAGIPVDQDHVLLEGGSDWWLQLEAAIKWARFLVLVMTPAAMRSEFVKKEWRLARQEGVCVYPVKAGSKADFDGLIGTLPRWMRDMHFYDLGYDPDALEHGDEWETLLADLHKDCTVPRVPFMVEDLPADFVARPQELDALLRHLLDGTRENPVAITAALKGAGGYGKTTLARALCQHEDIQQAFDDGVLWVTLGETPGDLTGRVLDLVVALTGTRPAVSGLDAAKTELGKALADRDILLVIDDAWDSAHVKPFLTGGERCARLITTRDAGTLPTDVQRVDVDAMREGEAVALLRTGLPDGEPERMARLADRLGGWALLLTLVNGALRNRVEVRKQSLAAALDYVEEALDELGLTAFDATKSADRHRAVASTLGVSLRLLDERELQHFAELAIFPEDRDIPLPALEKLWGMKAIATERLVERLDDLSLLLRFDATRRTIRLHDVVRGFLRLSEQSPLEYGEKSLPAIHGRFLDAYGVTRWADLPADEPYLWDELVHHLIEAYRRDELARTVTDLRYVARKTHLRDPYAAEADLTHALAVLPADNALRTLKRQYGNMAHILNRCDTEGDVMATLHARLQYLEVLRDSCTALLAEFPRPFITSWRALPDLPHPALIRTLTGHRGEVNSCAIGGGVIVSASNDHTLKVWDLTTGTERFTLFGHTAAVKDCAVGTNCLVSASLDGTVKVWNLTTGAERLTLLGHKGRVNGCAIGGGVIVSASDDHTLKVWDLTTGTERFTLLGHITAVNACAVGTDCIVSASDDHTLKVWDLTTGTERFTLLGHTRAVENCAVGEGVIISASGDGTVKVWDLLTGTERFTLLGHNYSGWGCAVGEGVIVSATDNGITVWDLATGVESNTLNGTGPMYGCAVGEGVIISASSDGMVRMWDLVTRVERFSLAGYRDAVLGIAAGEGMIVAASGMTLKVWDSATGAERFTLTGHKNLVFGCAVGGGSIASTDAGGEVKVWDSVKGAERFTFTEHTSVVYGCALGEGTVISASQDNTVKVRDLTTGTERFTLTGRTTFYGCAVGEGVVVSGSDDSTVKVWDSATGAERFTLTGHTALVKCCALGKDVIVSASWDSTVKVWDLMTGAERFTLIGHTSWVSGCAVGESTIISASYDGTVRVWDLHTGAPIAIFRTEGALTSCALLPDGEHIIAGGGKGLYWLRLVR